MPKTFSKLKVYEIVSIFPSLAKARYNSPQIIEELGKELLFML